MRKLRMKKTIRYFGLNLQFLTRVFFNFFKRYSLFTWAWRIGLSIVLACLIQCSGPLTNSSNTIIGSNKKSILVHKGEKGSIGFQLKENLSSHEDVTLEARLNCGNNVHQASSILMGTDAVTWEENNWSAWSEFIFRAPNMKLQESSIDCELLLDPLQSTNLEFDGYNMGAIPIKFLGSALETSTSPGIVVSDSLISVMENQRSSYTIKLRTKPALSATTGAGFVSIRISPGSWLRVNPSELTFFSEQGNGGNWNIPQRVEIIAEDNGSGGVYGTSLSHFVVEGSTDSGYVSSLALDGVMVNILDDDDGATDNDGASRLGGLLLPSSVQLDEGADTGATYMIHLSHAPSPGKQVRLALRSNDSRLRVSPSSFTFDSTNYLSGAAIIVRSSVRNLPESIKLSVEHRLLKGESTDDTFFLNRQPSIDVVVRPIVDDDGDGLIEISTVKHFNNIRHMPYGIGYKSGADAAINQLGCPGRDGSCTGYELVVDIDLLDLLDTNENGRIDLTTVGIDKNGNGDDTEDGERITVIDTAQDTSWVPIGDLSNPFTATFDGNNHFIKNLWVNVASSSGDAYAGLFGVTSSFYPNYIKNVHILSGSVHASSEIGNAYAGGLLGRSIGHRNENGLVAVDSIIHSIQIYGYGVSSSANKDAYAGGLVGLYDSLGLDIKYNAFRGKHGVSSYSSTGSAYSGGLLGEIFHPNEFYGYPNSILFDSNIFESHPDYWDVSWSPESLRRSDDRIAPPITRSIPPVHSDSRERKVGVYSYAPRASAYSGGLVGKVKQGFGRLYTTDFKESIVSDGSKGCGFTCVTKNKVGSYDGLVSKYWSGSGNDRYAEGTKKGRGIYQIDPTIGHFPAHDSKLLRHKEKERRSSNSRAFTIRLVNNKVLLNLRVANGDDLVDGILSNGLAGVSAGGLLGEVSGNRIQMFIENSSVFLESSENSRKLPLISSVSKFDSSSGGLIGRVSDLKLKWEISDSYFRPSDYGGREAKSIFAEAGDGAYAGGLLGLVDGRGAPDVGGTILKIIDCDLSNGLNVDGIRVHSVVGLTGINLLVGLNPDVSVVGAHSGGLIGHFMAKGDDGLRGDAWRNIQGAESGKSGVTLDIQEVIFKGSVSSDTKHSRFPVHSGGLVGYFDARAGNGGIVGFNDGGDGGHGGTLKIINSRARGTVSSTSPRNDDWTYAGGLVGHFIGLNGVKGHVPERGRSAGSYKFDLFTNHITIEGGYGGITKWIKDNLAVHDKLFPIDVHNIRKRAWGEKFLDSEYRTAPSRGGYGGQLRVKNSLFEVYIPLYLASDVPSYCVGRQWTWPRCRDEARRAAELACPRSIDTTGDNSGAVVGYLNISNDWHYSENFDHSFRNEESDRADNYEQCIFENRLKKFGFKGNRPL